MKRITNLPTRADKYDPRFVYRSCPRHVVSDLWEWLRLHPVWIIILPPAYLEYLLTTDLFEKEWGEREYSLGFFWSFQN